MGEETRQTSHDPRDEDDDDESDYDETDGGNRMLGFMFGNVDDAGDLDADYLDKDAKEHIAALADKLGSSLTDIDLSIKSSQRLADASEQDYDEKAEDAVDYEDIDEQYEGPETITLSEEDHLLPQKEYFSAGVSVSTMEHKNSVFDEDNYDEDEDLGDEHNMVDNSNAPPTVVSAGNFGSEHSLEPPYCGGTIGQRYRSSPERGGFTSEQLAPYDDGTIEQCQQSSPDRDEILELLSDVEKASEVTLHSVGSSEDEKLALDLEDSQDEAANLQESFNETSVSSLPILCIEDGMEVLRFSEIFGIHEPLKKGEKLNRRYPIPKEKYNILNASVTVEEDEEAFLRGSSQGFVKPASRSQIGSTQVKENDTESVLFGFCQGVSINPTEDDEQKKNLSLFAEPMKENVPADLAAEWGSPACPKFYPLDQQEWEDEIIWGNSPLASHASSEICTTSGIDSEAFVNIERDLEIRPQDLVSQVQMEPNEEDYSLFLRSFPVSEESFGSRNISDSVSLPSLKNNHPQLLRLESCMRVDDSNYSEGSKESATEHLYKGGTIKNFSKLSLQNLDMLEDSWLGKIIWDPDVSITKPKLILDLRDEQMLFEILETQDVKDLRLHAGAMIVTRSTKANGGDSFDLPGQGGASIGRFNISNDKYYSNRKTSQQLKSHSKKRAAHGVKVLHSTPALKLQTMKPKLSNKDIANFHRPKALWYPHDNEVAAREQGKLSTQGPMKIILRSMGGKGSKLHVNAEETISSVIAKASKKLDFKPSEKVQIIYSGKELEESKSLAEENVRPNSVLHLVRTKIHLWPRAQKLPGENKSLRPPGAFKKKSDLSVKDGHVFLMEYCEERPLLLGNVGMGARLCTYYQKVAPGDQKASLLRNESSSLGNILTLDPADKSPFLGDIKPGFNQSCIETNMYRAPIFPHKLPSTDYLLVRSSKGKLSLRRIDRVDVVGQQEPHMEVISPGTKNLQTYIVNRLLVHIYREFRAIEKRGLLPRARADELSAQFPSISEPFLRKRLKHCADLQRGLNGQLFWVKRRNFRIPLEEELRRMVTPENVCAYESMQAGLYRLKRLGISRLTHPTGLSSAMNQLPDEAIALAAASHIERELQITPWNLSSNFVACTNQDRENIERLEITGVGDPSGRGLGFSYVRVAPKAPMSSAVVKKKTAIPRGAATVTGTDADLRRLSMEAAREVLLKFNVPEEQIAKQTRWHRIAMIRKLSSEQAASGVKVDPTTISKYARGQRMSFLQLQQQTREKCQEIWDRQLLSLSAADGDEIDSDSEPNSDLDSFAGDLENLLDAEECGTGDGNYESKHSKADGAMGLKMRRHSSQPQADEEIEDEAAEAAELCRMLMDDDESEQRKKKPGGRDVASGWQSGFVDQTKCTNTMIKQIIRKSLPNGSFTSKENIIRDPKQVEGILAKRTVSGKVKVNKGNGKNDIAHVGPLKKQIKVIGDGLKVNKEKKPTGKGRRDEFTCSACGQSGHMKTNKNCPEYGKEHGKDLQLQVESTVSEKASGKSNSLEPHALLAQKTSTKKLIPKGATKIALVETSDNTEKEVSTPKVIQLKVKCAPPDKLADKMFSGGSRSSDKQVASDAETGMRKINKIIISNKMKPEDVHIETPKPSVVIRPPAETEMDQPRKKIIIKQSKVVINVDQVRQEVNSDFQEDYRKTKKMSELSSMEKHKKQESKKLAEETVLRKAMEERRLWEEEEEEKRRRDERNREERERLYEEEKWMQAKQQRLADVRYETMWKEEPEQHHAKKKKKKKKLPEMADEYFNEQRPSRSDQRLPERNRGSKRRPVMDLGRYSAEHAPQTKRRRGGAGEVGLANILESIVESLRDATEVSYLFLKPVSKKEAPDYLDVIKHPMDLATIKEKVRKMEYKSREDFRHDVWQITFNAHQYNDGRNPGIPPLADQLLELCDYLLEQNDERLCEAEAGIEIIDP